MDKMRDLRSIALFPSGILAWLSSNLIILQSSQCASVFAFSVTTAAIAVPDNPISFTPVPTPIKFLLFEEM